MKKNIDFSIIVPVYNVEKYLHECVDSLLTQTYENFEIILVNDGSPDRCGQICDEYANVFPNVRVIHKENGGLSDARNKGLEIAEGDYVIFLDSDDLWNNSTALETIANRIKLTDADVLSFNYVKFTNDTCSAPYFTCQSMPADEKNSFSWQMHNGTWIACAWNKAIRRTLFDNGELRFVEGITSEDIDWCARLAVKATNFDYIDNIVVRYRQRDGSITKSISPAAMETLMNNIERCIDIVNSNCHNANLLKPYVGYQYGTALLHLSTLPDSPQKSAFISRAKTMQYLLKWSDSKKVKLLRITTALGGIKLTLLLLKFKNR